MPDAELIVAARTLLPALINVAEAARWYVRCHPASVTGDQAAAFVWLCGKLDDAELAPEPDSPEEWERMLRTLQMGGG